MNTRHHLYQTLFSGLQRYGGWLKLHHGFDFIPVIVNDTPVYREVIADGETGFVYRNLDDLAALPDRLSDAERVDAVRTAAMVRSEAFSLAKTAALWRALVEND